MSAMRSISASFYGPALFLLFCIVLSHASWTSKKVIIIDEDVSSLNIDQVAILLCSKDQRSADKNYVPDRQISRISTIEKLYNYFDQLPVDSELNECKISIFKSLRDLKDLISDSNENVCDDRKISKIEEFHWQFISLTKEDIERRSAFATRDEVPVVLKYFFVHYALLVSTVCQKSLINNIEWDLTENYKNEELIGDSHMEMMRSVIAKMGKIFHPDDPVQDYDDVILIWKVVNGASKNGAKEDVKIRMKLGDASFALAVKEKCDDKFEPIYGKLIMPLVRLANIGYANTGRQFEREKNELKSNKLIRHWYSITQICETIKPFEFYQDDSLDPKECILISAEEAREITSQIEASTLDSDNPSEHKKKKIVYEPSTNNLSKLDRINSIESNESRAMVSIALINSNESVRSKQVKKIIKRLGNHLKDYVMNSPMVKFFVSRKSPSNEKRYIKEDMQELLFDTAQSSTDIDDDNDDNDDGLVKNEEELLSKKGAVERRRGRQRRGDLDHDRQRMTQRISYRHSRPIGDIMAQMSTIVNALLPSKKVMFIMGAIIVMIAMCFVFGSITAAG